MTFDLNPKFTTDAKYVEDARRVADFLWENCPGDSLRIPHSYCENLGYEYADGNVSYLNLLSKVRFSEDVEYSEYQEVVNTLMYAEPGSFPLEDSIVEIPAGLLIKGAPEPEFSELDFSFAEADDMSNKIETFLKKVIASVYTDGVTRVTDAKGNPPNKANNYLLSEDGNKFSGLFFDLSPGEKGKKYPFEIKQSSNGNWSISY
jgi:hypothetical protein